MMHDTYSVKSWQLLERDEKNCKNPEYFFPAMIRARPLQSTIQKLYYMPVCVFRFVDVGMYSEISAFWKVNFVTVLQLINKHLY